MAEAGVLARLGPLAGRRSASVTSMAPATRFSFRGSPSAAAKLGAFFGAVPGAEPCRAVVAGDRAALWLGPDEWMLIAAAADGDALFGVLERSLDTEPHSLVDVSHRNTGFDIVGTAAPEVLNEGCSLDFDLAAFPTGMCTRTVLGKSEVMLWRVAPHHFRLECWRSFAPYVSAFLTQAIEDQD